NPRFTPGSAGAITPPIPGSFTPPRDTSRHAVKSLARLTHASERTVQNWLSGVRGPNGVHLILLAQNFAAIRSTIMFLAGQGMQQSADLEAVIQLLLEAIAKLNGQVG
ncbi:hypothetical protein, partial [Burkholderia cepacia]|uniref:hypothetical protein n=1 Tax=Burkholderia cepacia TaxID=292 RepID=UPI0015F8C551